MALNASARLAAALPDGDKNGLPLIVPQMIDDPTAVHLAIVTLDVRQVTTNIAEDATVPTIRIRSIEPIPEGDDAKMVRRLIRRRFESRTGKVELPLDMELALEGIGVDGQDPHDPQSTDPDVQDGQPDDDQAGQEQLPDGQDDGEQDEPEQTPQRPTIPGAQFQEPPSTGDDDSR